MKVTDDMIHPDIRKQGILLRKYFHFHSRSSLFRSQRIFNATRWMMKTRKLRKRTQRITTPDNPSLRVCIYTAPAPKPGAIGLLWLHGGGYAFGGPEQDLSYIQNFVQAANCVVVAPDYRLSTQAPYPAALQDAYQALLWMKQNAAQLGIRDDQLFIGGESAGGGLAIATCLLARDKKEVNLAFQMPFYPMIDDRNCSASAQGNDAPVWDSLSNKIAWGLYLGPLWGTDAVPSLAAPARETDFTGLPPAYTFVGGIEPFCDETLKYVQSLQQAGIQAEIDVYPGCFHGFDVACKKAAVAQQATHTYLKKFQHAAEHYFAPQG